MSRENVDVVRQALEAWQHDDQASFLAVMDPAVEWHAALERLLFGRDGPYRGHEGVVQLWTVYRTEVEDFRITAHELREVGGRVVLLANAHFRGLASGIELDSPLALVVTVRDGKVVHSVDYLSHAEALEAVGLRE